MTLRLNIALQTYDIREVEKASLARQRTSMKLNIESFDHYTWC